MTLLDASGATGAIDTRQGGPAPASTPTTAPVPDTTGGGLGEAWPLDRRPSRRQLPRPVRRLIGPVVVIALWQVLCSTGVLGPRTMAPPSDVLSAGWELLQTGELQEHLRISLRRAVTGLAIGVSVGVTLAVLAGLFRRGEDLVDPTLQIMRAIPVLGLLPLVIIWFGIGESAKVSLVAIGTAFPVYVNTYAGIRGVDSKLVETATTFKVSRWGLIRHVVLPGAVPNFLVGLRFSLTGAWLIMIVAEQINAKSGIGYLMNEARTWFRTDIIVLGLVIYGVLGLLTDGLVRLLERSMLKWRRGFSGT
jgi:sulfonate transport system permease protein